MLELFETTLCRRSSLDGTFKSIPFLWKQLLSGWENTWFLDSWRFMYPSKIFFCHIQTLYTKFKNVRAPPTMVWTFCQKRLHYQFLTEFGSIKKLNFSDMAWVGRWYWNLYFLKHVDQFQTKKLLTDIKIYIFFLWRKTILYEDLWQCPKFCSFFIGL